LLGPERGGLLPRLPWKRDWTHASLGFGHEISVTFWQHAAALAAVVRGGEWRPLNLIDAVEQNGELHPVARAEPRPGFTRRSSDEVRAMMLLGAREGTGDRVSRPDLVMGTKTGTAEKVSTELCLHVEHAHLALEHACSKACLRALRGQKAHRRSCYTSSMCTFGRLPDSPREVLVFVVVDEPRGRAKYGADVAGKAAVAILARALGADARQGVVADESGFASLAEPAPPQLAEQPWAEMPDDDAWESFR
jgi:cell division protein FtsI/penicillin-binding protein 2